METEILLNQIAIMKALLDIQLGGRKYNDLKARIAETEKMLETTVPQLKAVKSQGNYVPYVNDK